MAEPLLKDIVTYLTTKGVIVGDGIDTFRDFVPETPDDIVSITEYQGSPPQAFEQVVHRSVQVLVRNKNADIARSKSLEIFRVLQNDILSTDDSRVDFTSERWGQVSLRQTPFRVGTDSSDRVKYAFNMGITTTID